MIKYLMKFVSQKKYAEMLSEGQLFMRPASYFHTIEQGQGDIHEASIHPYAQIYMNASFPIYCFYSVFENDLYNNTIRINSQCINDFKCADGYVVIIDFEAFEKRLPTLQTGGYRFAYGLVEYRTLQDTEIANWYCQ